MSVKEAILEQIRLMPDEATREEILDSLADGFAPDGEHESEQEYADYVRLEIDIGLRQIENGEGISHEEVKRRIAEKFKGVGG